MILTKQGFVMTIPDIRKLPINRPLLRAIAKMRTLKTMQIYDCVVFDGKIPHQMVNAWRMGKEVFVLYIILTPPWDYFSYGRVVFLDNEEG